MFTWVVLFCAVLSGARLGAVGTLIGPETITTCEEFEQDAYFNPYEIVDSNWKIFYFWGNTTELYPIVFSLPTSQRLMKIRAVIAAVEPHLEIEWARAVLIMEPRPGLMVVFLYAGTPGAFRALVKMERPTEVRPHPLPLIKFSDVRLKQVDEYIAMMCCEDLTAYAFARVELMPATEQDCVKAALKVGVRLPNGRPYLFFKREHDEL